MNSQKIKEFFKKLGGLFRLFAKECLIPAVAVNLCVEAFSRQSVLKPFVYLFTSPVVFCYNAFLIAITLSLCYLFKRRRFACFFIAALWIAAGIADYVLLQFRTTPFTAQDLRLIDSAFSVMTHYLNPFEIVLVAIGFVLAVIFAVFLFLRAKKTLRAASPLVAGALCTVLILSGILSTKLFMSVGILERNFGNIAQAFHKNGLPYCFFSSLFGTGISKPNDYSEKEIDRILTSITNAPTHPTPSDSTTPNPALPSDSETERDKQPNFVFLQLESFFDPTYIKGASFSADPLPIFRQLREKNSSGFLTVPSIGAGTANTEFELLTGINLDFFGPGEYPYKTILKETTCESIAYNLSAVGYNTHAIHNNDGTFYGRHRIFSQLGFDTFTPIEYMGSYETTPLGWAKDRILTKEILNALTSTETKDLVYTISVQAHGAYPDEAILENPEISIVSLPEELEDYHYQILYLVNQLHEVDKFLGELITALEKYDEEIVLVLYGDHLPTFPFTDELLLNDSIFDTEYVIWNNRRTTTFEDRNVEAYALTAHVLNCYDIHQGLFTRFHQTQSSSPTYMEDLKMLAYDVLYGDIASYDGVLPFKATDLQFGTRKIELHNVLVQQNTKDYTHLYVKGTHFTPYSTVFINGEKCTTVFVNNQLLSVSEFEPADVLEVYVAQVGKNSTPLSTTNTITVVEPVTAE